MLIRVANEVCGKGNSEWGGVMLIRPVLTRSGATRSLLAGRPWAGLG